MAYTKQTWLDRVVQFPRRFKKSGESATQVTLEVDPGVVTEEGTPVNAARLTHVEEGIDDAAMIADNAYALGINAMTREPIVLSGATDWDTITQPGIYFVSNQTDDTNAPWTGAYNAHLLVYSKSGIVKQIAEKGQAGTLLTMTRISTNSGSTWSAWFEEWNTSKLRDNSGVLELLTGGEWKVVGSNKIIVPSSTLQESFDTVRTPSTTNKQMLIAKHLPKATGELKVEYEYMLPDSSYGVQVNLIANTNRGFSTGVTGPHTVNSGSPALFNWTTPLGTSTVSEPAGQYRSPINVNYSTLGAWTKLNQYIYVFEGVPIYFAAGSNSTAGNPAGSIRNFRIYYDVIDL